MLRVMNVTINFESLGVTVFGSHLVPRIGEVFVLSGAVGSTPSRVTDVHYQFHIFDKTKPPEITVFILSEAVAEK